MIYVTHRLNEVFRISQRVTVFRDGANAGMFPIAETDMKQLVAAIVGPGHAALQAESKRRRRHRRAGRHGNVATTSAAASASTAPVLNISNVSNDRLHDVDLVRATKVKSTASRD